MALAVALLLPAGVSSWGRKEVKMRIRPPDCGKEVLYRRSFDEGRKSETYAVHAEKLRVNGEVAYQSISLYEDRVRRITMRGKDLTPLHMEEVCNDGSCLIKRTYHGKTVHVVRKNRPYPIDETIEVPQGVHDPESFAFLLKGYPFEMQDTVAPINVLVAHPNPLFKKPRTFALDIVPLGEERVSVPAGEFDCYVLEMSLSGVLGFVAPDNRFWLLKQDPHLIVKAEGGGETVELMAGPFPCSKQGHCKVKAKHPPQREENR